VVLKIYNLLGQEVKTLVNGYQNAGLKSVQWDGRDNSGKPAGSGVYIYQVEAGNFVQSKKMVLLK
jgi:flagellar hook assembly protein FlgD